MLKSRYSENENIIEIGVDEAGRGPLFGRVYAAAVILPKDNFDHDKMKDSKKFHSEKKINLVADYIKENAIGYSIEYMDEKDVDNYNILKASQMAMTKCVKKLVNKNSDNDILALLDGNQCFPIYFEKNDKVETVKSVFIEGGDNKYTAIAAASILAKVTRDKYIIDLCDENPELKEKYFIHKNKGYGTKQHLDGIKNNGITKWHRKSFGICKSFD